MKKLLYLLFLPLVFAISEEKQQQACDILNFSFQDCADYWGAFQPPVITIVNQTVIVQNITFVNTTINNTVYVYNITNTTINYTHEYHYNITLNYSTSVINNDSADQRRRDDEYRRDALSKGYGVSADGKLYSPGSSDVDLSPYVTRDELASAMSALRVNSVEEPLPVEAGFNYWYLVFLAVPVGAFFYWKKRSDDDKERRLQEMRADSVKPVSSEKVDF